MNLAELLEKSAEHHPDSPALAFGRTVVETYAQHCRTSAELANGLRREWGLRRGDVVALAMKNHPVFSEILFAIWHAGCVAVPINARLHPEELAWILDNARARFCFLGEELADPIIARSEKLPWLDHVFVPGSQSHRDLQDCGTMPMETVDGDDAAWLFYTSGTTGRPKGAVLTHGNLRAMNTAYFANVDRIEAKDCIIHAAPMSHGSGLYLLPHVERAACQIVPDSGGFDPAETLELLSRYAGATLFLAPTMLMRLVGSPIMDEADLSGLKTIVYGGGPMYVEDLMRAREFLGPRLVQIYGQGESPMTITVLSRDEHENRQHPRHLQRMASVGKAQAGVEVRIVDEDDQAVAAGQIGEIVVRGDVVMKGYYRNPDASAETLRGGWLHTGDVGSLDEDGFLTLRDRARDLIISGGSNIYPREVEEVLLRHPDVMECAVVGRTHEDWGEEVVAFVVPRAGTALSEAELDQLCLDHIARFKRPRVYRQIDSLPKNNYGKVLKTELRQQLIASDSR